MKAKQKRYCSKKSTEEDVMDTLDTLFQLEPEQLFQSARTMAEGKKQILSSPAIIDGRCTTEPQCRHCKWRGMRGSNHNFFTRKTVEEIVAHAINLKKEGTNRIFLASGWMGYDLPDYYYDYVKAVKANTALEIFGLFGAVNKASLAALKHAGMDGYLCGIESPSEEVYKSFRPGGDTLSSRIEALYNAKELGLKIWTGFLYGLGETDDDMKKALRLFEKLDVDSISILPFEPFPYTEMEKHDSPNLYNWSKIVAIAGIFLGNVSIFSLFGQGNLYSYSIRAGANGFYFFPNRRP